ncbi:hypothetical protein [Aeromonas sp. HMWF015]|uniref:hypothetical protein n=1 Tax=Aeromonas sp. HMWF015 TaxID=2056851 RepID=UPI0011B27C3E|nr:hypothetical protein [Aeromonas sp. HMWF015]
MKRLQELDDILFSNELGCIYDFLGDRDNGLVFPFFAKYMDAVKKVGLEFCVTTDTGIRAGILYKHKLIFVSYGIFDRLCKLALLVHSSGVLNGKPRTFNFVDLHLVDNPFVGFNYEDQREESEGDSHLLLFIFDCLLSFVVSHEVGHYVNKHGNREKISDDIEGHRKISRKTLIQSHARELVADNYAFRFLRKNIKDPIINSNPIIEKLLPEFKNEKGATLLALLFVACYFKLMDGNSPNSHFESTHPESAIRVHSIFATFIEPYMDTNEMEQYAQLFPLAITLLKAVFIHKDGTFDFNWQGRAMTPEMIQWHSEICSEYTNWCA